MNIDPFQQEAENQVFLKTCEKSPVTSKVDPLQQEAENQVYFFWHRLQVRIQVVKYEWV